MKLKNEISFCFWQIKRRVPQQQKDAPMTPLSVSKEVSCLHEVLLVTQAHISVPNLQMRCLWTAGYGSLVGRYLSRNCSKILGPHFGSSLAPKQAVTKT